MLTAGSSGSLYERNFNYWFRLTEDGNRSAAVTVNCCSMACGGLHAMDINGRGVTLRYIRWGRYAFTKQLRNMVYGRFQACGGLHGMDTAAHLIPANIPGQTQEKRNSACIITQT